MKKQIVLITLFILIVSFLIRADVESPTSITKINSTRHNTSGTYLLSGGNASQAGNVTYLTIVAEGITKTWSAYYGNVTGTLLLENFDGQKIYEWNLPNPGGKVLATETAVSDWTDVHCWNWSVATAQGLHYSEWNTNLSAVGVDEINSTFNASFNYTTFYLAGKEFNAETGTVDGNRLGLCPGTQLFNNSQTAVPENHQYEEIILSTYAPDDTTDYEYNTLIYVALIERGGLGFTGEQIDFQIIVPNDGHGASPTTSDYYFYVELEAA